MKINQLWLMLLLILFPGLSFAQGSGSSLEFDGVGDYLDLGAPSTLTNLGVGDLTLEAWVFPHTLNPSNMDMIFSARGADNNQKIQFGIDSEYLKFDRYPPAGAISTNPVKIQIGEWSHVAVVLRDDDDEVDFYVNGIKYTVSYTEEYTGGTPTAVSIGAERQNGSTTLEFDGLIDGVRIWSVARTETQIRDNMCKHLIGNEAGLVSYWQMDEGADNTCSGGQDACDLTSNGNHGTLR